LAINHTQADIARRQADKTDDPVKKEALRRIARNRLSEASNDEYYLHTKALLAIDVLRDILLTSKDQTTKGNERLIVEATKDAETAIQRGLQSAADIRALIVANNYLESEVSELMKAVSHAYVRGRFHTYSG
jgi:hypothetical protein